MNSHTMMSDTAGELKPAPRSILLATARSPELAAFTEELGRANRAPINTAASPAQALDAVRRQKTDLVIVDEGLDDASGLKLVRRILEIDAFIHTAVLSDADQEAFHERSEGLGVLSRLPLVPSPKDALRLLGLLNAVMPH